MLFSARAVGWNGARADDPRVRFVVAPARSCSGPDPILAAGLLSADVGDAGAESVDSGDDCDDTVFGARSSRVGRRPGDAWVWRASLSALLAADDGEDPGAESSAAAMPGAARDRPSATAAAPRGVTRESFDITAPPFVSLLASS